ncbi:MAG: pyruvate dehydrogenase (acetyl-transferring), homodimeric type [Acidobacteriia bacterium]|nr:pyruvate dehydrogenase (acetyl-transferring), homodimeric type [Terriglobia bacterium]
MLKPKVQAPDDLNPQETAEWIEALDEIIDEVGPDRANYLLERLMERAANLGVQPPLRWNTPYINTIKPEEEVAYPGDRAIERKIKSMARWNATAMVVRANKYDPNIGGHLATYASAATLFEVGFNHFFHGSYPDPVQGEQPGDFVYFQGHASPGIYARAFMEGRLSEQHLINFRHELRDQPGLSSYPHPWLMPDFWQFPTVSMGLGPISAIYQARFNKYLENRALIPHTPRKVWAFLGDGETDEPEALGALTLASREHLDNLIFVVNCNLQRLDGPVRGNGSIIQELEAAFLGAGWNVIKVIWGSGWDDLIARDSTGLLLKRMHECVDGEYQTFRAMDGAYIRKEFFGKYPELLKLVEHLSDNDIWDLRRGGHDPVKVYNAYKRAVEQANGKPTVILAKTVKGYGLGQIAEGRNTAHQQKKLAGSDLVHLRDRFELPLSNDAVEHIEFVRPAEGSPEANYMKARSTAMGGPVPKRTVKKIGITAPPLEAFGDAMQGSRGREASTTSAFVSILKTLMKSHEVGKLIVPIVPDEARTFGMESLFRDFGIYASQGQKYTPVDKNVLLYYKEAKDGQILEEGITEAGSMASFTAAGASYANLAVPTIPFFTFYSMFGFQRVGDLAWAFADLRGKGFLMGATAGRTTLLGEGLQHDDGHSPILASVVPTCAIYDPAYAYEVAVIIQDGIRRMYQEMEDRFYYITIYNENYVQPPMPEGDGIREGILHGIYKYSAAPEGAMAQLFGSGPMLNEALKAQKILAERYQIPTDVWSVTSYSELRRDALQVERWNRLHPSDPAKTSYIASTMQHTSGPIIASSDYIKSVPDQIAPWLQGRLTSLGTDGFGRSENREHLRRFFEISAEAIAQATLSALARSGAIPPMKAEVAIAELGFHPEKRDPAKS